MHFPFRNASLPAVYAVVLSIHVLPAMLTAAADFPQ